MTGKEIIVLAIGYILVVALLLAGATWIVANVWQWAVA